MVKEIPQHLAIIMDGNGRWAKKRFLPRTVGHNEGAKTLRKILTHSQKIVIRYLTVYAFSTENWKRAEEEVGALMALFKKYLQTEEREFMKNDVKFIVSGRREGVNQGLLDAIDRVQKNTSENKGITLNLAFNYGGRSEIIDGINKIIESGEKNITEESFRKYLYNDIPDPELLIRTSGEIRISNFLLWQIAYSEIYITEKLWPDFDERDLELAIESYTKRERRFGGVIDVK
ncbi:MAG: polyprenyl diphosphate synthase [Fusobacteriaceae bacterium]